MRIIDANKYCDFLNTYPLDKAQNNFMSFYRKALQKTYEFEVEAIPVEWLKNKSKDLADAYWNNVRNKLVLNMNELPLVIDEIVRIWEKENEHKESD